MPLSRDRLGLDVYGGRIVKHPLSQSHDGCGQGGGEEQGLLLPAEMVQDPANVRQEAHVQHSVCLVQDEELQPGQFRVGMLEVVQQTTRCSDDHIRARSERLRSGAPGPRRHTRLRPGVPCPRTSARKWSRIWAASSRVGVRTNARVEPRGRLCSRWRIGSRKAAVLPLPVAAEAIRSRPSSSNGIASCWMGVGLV